jgi:multiple sugar transport system ATP-binding protein
VRVDIRKLHDRLGATSVYVTHDQVEAMTLADVIFVLNKGVVEQSGPPLAVYTHPATRFVASFLGSPAMNFLDATLARVNGHVVARGAGGLELPIAAGEFAGELEPGREVTLGVRPHDVVPRGDADGGGAVLDVEIIESLGPESHAHGTLAGAPFVARLDAMTEVRKGTQVPVRLERVHVFDRTTGLSLRTAR